MVHLLLNTKKRYMSSVLLVDEYPPSLKDELECVKKFLVISKPITILCPCAIKKLQSCFLFGFTAGITIETLLAIK